jgi:hypothetical protein
MNIQVLRAKTGFARLNRVKMSYFGSDPVTGEPAIAGNGRAIGKPLCFSVPRQPNL